MKKKEIVVSKDGVKRLKCGHCHEWLALSCFSSDSRNHTGFDNCCRACKKERPSGKTKNWSDKDLAYLSRQGW